MLYDPKWQQTKEPSLEGLAMWLETKDPKTEYVWSDVDNCLIAQYLGSIGAEWNWNNSVAARGGKPIALERPHTFGAALDRARRVLKHGA